MTANRFDAVVVGAGPAGTATAILLARAGWSVALVEKQRFPRRKVCGECIAASNLPLLDALGLGNAIAHLAGPDIRRIGLMSAERIVTAEMPPVARQTSPWGRALGREVLDTLLLEEARKAGAAIFQPCAVDAIDGVPGQWSCHVRGVADENGYTLYSAVLVDAHGSWESLRASRAALRHERRASDLFAFKANFTGSTLEAGLLPVLAVPGGYGGMITAGAGVTTLACCIRRDRLEAIRRTSVDGNAGNAVEQYLRSQCRGARLALDSAVRDGAWIASGPLHPGVRHPVPGQPFRVGNAAGEAHPIIGEGMSMALQAAFMLTAALLPHGRGLADASAAMHDNIHRDHGRQWRRHFGPRLRLASLFAHAAMRPSASASLMLLAGRFPGLLPWGARLVGKNRCAVDAPSITGPYATLGDTGAVDGQM